MPKKNTKKKGDSLVNAIKDIKAKHGDDAIMKLDDQPVLDVEFVSTGSLGLDNALGVGGLPCGRVSEIYGAEATGKTTLALHVIAEAQKKDMPCAFIDAEHALDTKYARKIGVDTKELYISQPDSGENALDILQMLIETKEVGVIVIDSVAALTPQQEIDGEIGDHKIAAHARLMSKALRRLTSLISKSNTIVIFLNQLRVDIGAYAPGTYTPLITTGGKALRFYTSVRIELKRVSWIKKGDETIGSRIRAKVVKNKVASPFRETEFDILYNEGISKMGEVLILGEKYRVLQKAGAMYSYDNKTLGRGYGKALSFLQENPKVAEEIIRKIKEHHGKE